LVVASVNEKSIGKIEDLRLDIGCGLSKRQGFIGLDVRKTDNVDVIADARMLPFKNNAFTHVFSSHLIEHFSQKATKEVLREWLRVLRQGGTMELRCPDLRARALLFFLNPTWRNIENIYGEQDFEGNFHKCGFSYGLMKSLLESLGLKRVRRVIKGYKGVPFLPDSLHIEAAKE
jgi:SAM-dependent methyltransferase